MWKDITTYRQGDKERKPTSYQAKSGSLVITVTCGHVMHRPNWIMHCYQLGLDTVPLELGSEASPQEAQAKAINVVKKIVQKLAVEAEGFTV